MGWGGGYGGRLGIGCLEFIWDLVGGGWGSWVIGFEGCCKLVEGVWGFEKRNLVG